MQEHSIQALVAKYVKDGDVVAFGTDELTEHFLKKLAMQVESEGHSIKVIPTSLHTAAIAASLKLPIVSINDEEVDVAIEFVDQIDTAFNFIKRNTASLVLDKMIAQSAEQMIAIAKEENYVKRLHGSIPFEACHFGWKRSLVQLGKLGEASLRMKGKEPFKTESGNCLIDVKVDEIYSYEELEMQAKEVPGVVETGLFIGYADRIVLFGKELAAKSRMVPQRKDSETATIAMP